MTQRDIVEVLENWPQPDSGAPSPRVSADEYRLVVCYIASGGLYAVVEFPLCHQFTFGDPNDETLNSRPLYEHGLKFYSVHRVRNSSRLAALERANSVHPRHDATSFLRHKEHYVFTFHDSTLECLVTSDERSQPRVNAFASPAEANAALHARVAQPRV